MSENKKSAENHGDKDIKTEIQGLFDDVEDTSALKDDDVIKRFEDYLEGIDPDAVEQSGVLMDPDDIITLTDERGEELHFTEVAEIMMQGKTYALLQSLDDASADEIVDGNCPVYVFEVTNEGTESGYVSVEDDELLDEIVKNYEAMVSEYYNSLEED